MDESGDRVEILPPNLRPRHQNLIPTPCGPVKSWSELSWRLRAYYCFTILSLLLVLSFTLWSIYNQSKASYKYGEDFTVSLVQMVGMVFCIYYITRAILQENRQELMVFMLSILLLMVRAVVNFTVLTSEERREVEVRFGLIVALGVVHLVFSALLLKMPNMMAFRVSGALQSLQDQYFFLNLCFSMVTFDLQAQLCLCILILTSGISVSEAHTIILIFGICWAVATAICGGFAVLKEVKPLVWVFGLQNLPELAYLIYMLYTVGTEWGHGGSYTLEAAAVTGSVISVLIKGVLFVSMYHLYHSFGQGLRERMFQSDSS